MFVLNSALPVRYRQSGHPTVLLLGVYVKRSSKIYIPGAAFVMPVGSFVDTSDWSFCAIS
jgi:hypothetical protein